MAEIVSYGGHAINDGTDYRIDNWNQSYTLPASQAEPVEIDHTRPLIGAVALPAVNLPPFVVRIIDEAAKATLRAQLFHWFDPDDCDAYPFVIQDTGGGNTRYVIAKSVQVVEVGDRNGLHFAISLVVHGDVRWRSTMLANATWLIDDETGETTVTNAGEADAYPVLSIQPTAAKTGSNPYKIYSIIDWDRAVGYTGYPLDITANGWDTDALIAASKMQSAGEDIRVYVDGQAVDFWLQDINTTTTQVWANLNWQATQAALLKTGFDDVDTVTEIEASSSINNFSSTGWLKINSEVFSYTGKNNALRRFTGVARAAMGTAAATHAIGATARWIQHEVAIAYGDLAAAAWTPDNAHLPAFELDSTNTSWVYEIFGSAAGTRTAPWSFTNILNTANGEAALVAWTRLSVGQLATGTTHFGYMSIYNPFGINAANFTNGDKRRSSTGWGASIDSRATFHSPWVVEATITSPASPDSDFTWSANVTSLGAAEYVRMFLGASGDALLGNRIRADDVTVTLAGAPAILLSDEVGAYDLAATITNVTTAQAITLSLSMALEEELEVDTDAKTLTLLDDGTSKFGALLLVGGPRRDWLKFAPGTNELEFSDAGTNGLVILLFWQERYYT